MEIKIIISDTPAGSQVTASSETLQAAIAIDAIDAGPAPGAGGSTQPGAPSPFISGSTPGDVTTSSVWAGSCAAMPDSGNVIEAITGTNVNE